MQCQTCEAIDCPHKKYFVSKITTT
jgi:hypothetical protein